MIKALESELLEGFCLQSEVISLFLNKEITFSIVAKAADYQICPVKY